MIELKNILTAIANASQIGGSAMLPCRSVSAHQ